MMSIFVFDMIVGISKVLKSLGETRMPKNKLAEDRIAASFLKAGIGMYEAGDMFGARGCFGLAKQVFEEVGDSRRAKIAAGWLDAVGSKANKLTL